MSETEITREGAEIPNETQTPAEPSNLPDFGSIVPQDYVDKGWVKDVKDIPQFFQMYEDAKVAMSKRPAGIPQNDDPQEKWDAFNKALGVPEKPDDYKFSTEPPDENTKNFQSKIAGLFHKAGVTPRQLSVIEPGWNELIQELGQANQPSQEEMDKEFDELASKTFGDQEKQVLKNSNALLAKYVPEDLKPALGGMSNEGLVLMAAVLEGVRKDYISEDRLPDDREGGISGSSEKEKREEARGLMASDAYRDPFHKDHKETVEKVQKIYGTFQEKK